eukprot:7597686-Ditylum_brightwellii.AAC.1
MGNTANERLRRKRILKNNASAEVRRIRLPPTRRDSSSDALDPKERNLNSYRDRSRDGGNDENHINEYRDRSRDGGNTVNEILHTRPAVFNTEDFLPNGYDLDEDEFHEQNKLDTLFDPVVSAQSIDDYQQNSGDENDKESDAFGKVSGLLFIFT